MKIDVLTETSALQRQIMLRAVQVNLKHSKCIMANLLREENVDISTNAGACCLNNQKDIDESQSQYSSREELTQPNFSVS